MAESKFDLSLLKPVDETNADFENKLKPLDENEEDEGAYLDSLPAPEGFFNKLPRNLAIGLAKLGHSTMNIPHDLAQGAENSLGSLGNNINKAFPLPKAVQENIAQRPKHEQFKLSDYIPHQQEYDFAQMLGQQGEGTLMDKLIQKGVEYAPEIVGGGALLRGGLRRLKGTHQLDEVARRVNRRGLPITPYSPQTIAEAKRYLPSSMATDEMIEAVRSGQYNPAFAMQSQIGHHQRKLAKSPLAAENLRAPRAGELKQKMLNHLEQALRSSNFTEDADMLRSGINNYRQYIKVKDASYKAMKKLGLPTTVLAALGFGYKKTKKLLPE